MPVIGTGFAAMTCWSSTGDSCWLRRELRVEGDEPDAGSGVGVLDDAVVAAGSFCLARD